MFRKKDKVGEKTPARDYQKEFLQERERLAKLWTAYEQMEKENNALKARITELTIDRAGPAGGEVAALMKENEALRGQVKTMKELINDLDTELKALKGKSHVESKENGELIDR